MSRTRAMIFAISFLLPIHSFASECPRHGCVLPPPAKKDSDEKIRARHEANLNAERVILAPLAAGISATSCQQALANAISGKRPDLAQDISLSCRSVRK